MYPYTAEATHTSHWFPHWLLPGKPL